MRTDDQLMSAWQSGDEAAGNELFERHFDGVFRFFRNKAESAAEDLVQQTFLSCLSSRDAFRADASFRTYLFTIAKSKLYDHLRGRKRRDVPIDLAEISVADLGTSPSRGLARHQDQALVQEALCRLPVELQIALELFYLEEMSAPEVAAVLGLPEGTVRSRLRRALEQLRGEVKRLGPSPAVTETALGRLATITAGRAP